MKSYPLVEWYGQKPMLFIEHPTGVFHTGQTGGMACLHPEVEGVAIPLESYYAQEWENLPTTCPDGCGGHYGLSEETFEKLEKVWPKQEYETYYIRLDRSRAEKGHESLLPVVVEKGKRELEDWRIDPMARWIIGKKGFILTQDNCD